MSEMRLKPDDVRRLYGTRFFVVPEKEAASELLESQDEESSPDPQPSETAPVETPPVATVSHEEPEKPEVIVFKEKEPPASTSPEPGNKEKNLEPAPIEAEAAEKPEVKKEPTPPAYALDSGIAVSWKMRRTSQLALVMDQEAFKNPAMTLILKDCVTKAGLNTQIIGFGVLEGEGPHWDFRAIPVPQAIIFHPFEGVSSPVIWADKQLHLFHSLKDIVFDPQKQKALIQLLSGMSFTS